MAGCVWARAATVSQVKAALTAKRKLAKGEYLPVSATLAVEQWDPDSRGVWPCSRPGLGYHQVLIKGWKKLGSKEYALIHNSWGQNWGMSGDALVEWDEALALGAYVLVPPEAETQEPEQSEPEQPKARRTLRMASPYMRDEDGYTDVSLCQTRLDVHGFSCGAMDGIYGPKTEAAVRSFQGAMGLDTDGICGSKTWAALDEEPGEEAADPETPADVEEPVIRRTLRLKTPYMRDEGGYQDVSLCQTRLAAHGFPCGAVDGIFGRNTEWAVRSFQAYAQLDADGICGSKNLGGPGRGTHGAARSHGGGAGGLCKGPGRPGVRLGGPRPVQPDRRPDPQHGHQPCQRPAQHRLYQKAESQGRRQLPLLRLLGADLPLLLRPGPGSLQAKLQPLGFHVRGHPYP